MPSWSRVIRKTSCAHCDALFWVYFGGDIYAKLAIFRLTDIPAPRRTQCRAWPWDMKSTRGTSMPWKKSLSAASILLSFLPGVSSGLVVDIQGTRLAPQAPGETCVDITGDYRGVRIEADNPGQTPRICYNGSRNNSVSIANATFIAKPPVKQEVVIKFEHEFPPGINGKIMARAKLQGFFATGSGVGVPTGDKLKLETFFSQGGSDDPIATPLDFTVGDQLDSALLEYSVKKQYLAAGPRSLKGVLKIEFTGAEHKLALPERCLISLDTGSTFEDKLDTLETLEDDEAPVSPEAGESGAEALPTDPGELENGLPPLPELQSDSDPTNTTPIDIKATDKQELPSPTELLPKVR
ncbi:hypothetical protein ACR2R6_08740 [Methylocaldum gracile subsp. desertum]|uniref:hypothetical protein n=1 Tax=Methylocaldum sp. GT1BW TaxID=3438964 RepID=UPI003DA1AFBF